MVQTNHDGMPLMRARLSDPSGTGQVISFDTRTRAACVIATGLNAPSSVKFGRGPGWPSGRLYVVAFGGTVHALTPPPRRYDQNSSQA